MDLLTLLRDHGPVSATQTSDFWAQWPSPSRPSHSAELSKAQQAWRYVLKDLMRQLVAQAKSLSSTKESQGKIYGLSAHSYGNCFLWWAPKNPVPKLFTNLSEIQGAITWNLWTAAFCTVTFPVGPPCFCHKLRCLWKQTEMEQRGPNQCGAQSGTGQTPAPQSAPSHNPSWMTSSLLPAQIPTGLVSRTDVHWFTAGRLFGRATTRSIIIF